MRGTGLKGANREQAGSAYGTYGFGVHLNGFCAYMRCDPLGIHDTWIC